MGGNLDAKEVEKAKAGQQADFPDVRAPGFTPCCGPELHPYTGTLHG